MAIRVPILPQVSENIRPGYRLDASAPQGAFGGGRPLAASVAQANDVIDAQRKAIFEDDFHEAIKAVTSLKSWQNQIGYKDVLGENTKDLGTRMQDAYSKESAKIAESLKNDRQRAIFQGKSDENKIGFTEDVDNHIRRQMGIAKAQAVDAFAATWQDAGIKAGASGNLAEMDRATKEIDGARRVWGHANGVPDTAVAQMVKDDTSKVYSGAILSMLNNKNYGAAKDALAKYGDQLPQKEKDRLTGLVKQESELGAAYEYADVVLSYDPETLQDALTHLDKLVEQEKLSPEVRQQATALTRERFGVMKAAKAQEYQNDAQKAANIIEETADIQKIPVQLREKLHRTDISALASRAAQIKRGEEPVTDWATYSSLRDMAANPNTRKDFLSMLPMAYRGKLSNTEFKEIVGLREGLIKGDGKTKKQIDGYLSTSHIINSVMDANGFKMADKPQERLIIEQVMDEEVKHYKVAHDGEEPPPEEVRKKISLLTTEAVVEPGTFFNRKEFGYQTTQKYLDIADKEVPAEERKKIEDAMKRQGVTPTRRGIVDAWREKKAMAPYERFLPK